MKVFLVFLALLFINVSFVTFAADLSSYLALRTQLKELAEECACGAAQYWESEAYSNGDFVIDEVEAAQFVAALTEHAEARLQARGPAHLAATMTASGPAVVVEVTLTTTTDLFRLPALTAKQVTRAAKYELAAPGTQ